jgi:hypothetical protein
MVWVCEPRVVDDGIFFPENIKANIPMGLNRRLVKESVPKKASRRKLFKWLDIKEYNTSDIVDAIAGMHLNMDVTNPPSNWTPAVLVSHTVYIYHARSYFSWRSERHQLSRGQRKIK